MYKVTGYTCNLRSDRRLSRSRIYIFPKGENLIQNLTERRSRPIKEWRQEVIPTILERAGLPADTKVRFSQTAGCGCGCSPGWIIESHYDRNYFVTVELENDDAAH